MNQVGVIAQRLAHEPNFRQGLEQSLSTSAAEKLTCEEQAALAAEGLALGREARDKWLTAISLSHSATTALVEGDLDAFLLEITQRSLVKL